MRIQDASPVARLLAAISVCVDVLVVLHASAADIYRCQDGYTNLPKVFVFYTVVIAIPAVAVVGHDLVNSDVPERSSLPPRYLVGLVVLASVAVVASLWPLRSRPELRCHD